MKLADEDRILLRAILYGIRIGGNLRASDKSAAARLERMLAPKALTGDQ